MKKNQRPPTINVESPATSGGWQIDLSRTMLADEVLSRSLFADDQTLFLKIGCLQGAQLLSKHGVRLANEVEKALQCIREKIDALIDRHDESDQAQRRQMHVDTLVGEIAALREIAYWKLDKSGALALEDLLGDLLEVYERARVLLMVIRENGPGRAEEVPPLPVIEPNPYLTMMR